MTQEKQGRETRNRADFDAMRGLVGFLTDECCSGVDLGIDNATQLGKDSETAA